MACIYMWLSMCLGKNGYSSMENSVNCVRLLMGCVGKLSSDDPTVSNCVLKLGEIAAHISKRASSYQRGK